MAPIRAATGEYDIEKQKKSSSILKLHLHHLVGPNLLSTSVFLFCRWLIGPDANRLHRLHRREKQFRATGQAMFAGNEKCGLFFFFFHSKSLEQFELAEAPLFQKNSTLPSGESPTT